MESFILCLYPYQCLPQTLVLTPNTGLVIPIAATRWHVLEKPNLLSVRQIPPLAAVVRCASKVARWRSTGTWGGTSVLKSQLPSATAKGTAPEDDPQLVAITFALVPFAPRRTRAAWGLLVCNLHTRVLAVSDGRDSELRSNVPAHSVSTIFSQIRFLNPAPMENLLWFCSLEISPWCILLCSYLPCLYFLLLPVGEAVFPAAIESCHPWFAKLLFPFVELPFTTDSIPLVYKQLGKKKKKELATTRN